MCFFLVTVILGPRAAILLWWLAAPGRWESAFDSFVLPALGFIFLPWTTLFFVAVAPTGSPSGADWAWLAIGFFLDMLSSGYVGFGRRAALTYH